MYRRWKYGSVVRHIFSHVRVHEFKPQHQRENKELPPSKLTPNIGFKIFFGEMSRALSFAGSYYVLKSATASNLLQL